ncbi:MAG: hypothetical protein LBC68_00855 [Prevotellaceae bacterium]|jgi:hypothetical protein|nr:hypothetical protein [Prevotellaceae bacterium]
MEQNEITSQLEDMIGKTYIYDNAHITVKDIKMRGEEIAVIITDSGKRIEVNVEDISDFKEVAEVSLVRKTEAFSVIMKTTENYEKLMNTLIGNIEKIDKNPEYIQRAEAINNTVKSIIELEKVRIATIGLLK